MESARRRAFLSLGSNLGDRARALAQALKALDREAGIELAAVSPVYETEPIGVLNQPAFLNLAAEIGTALAPLELLNAAKEAERALGRVDGIPWGPRPIDIDLVWVEGPRIATDWRDPLTGITAIELLHALKADAWVENIGHLDLENETVAPHNGAAAALAD